MHAGFLLCLLALPGADQTASSVEARSQPEPRKYHEIHRDLRALFRREYQASTNAERTVAIFEMTELYQEIRRDPRLELSPTLTGYKHKLWSRLTRIKADINKHLARAARLQDDPEPSLASLSADDQVTASLAAVSTSGHLALSGAAVGGPASVFSQGAARGGRAVPDYGPALVALIERTIAPEFWDTNGGPGSIVYYQPLMCLVVRATSEVHHAIGGVTGGLRAAGR